MELKPLPIGIQTFRKIIEGGYLYVDKTKSIYDLIRYPTGVYFLSRPRRFGKSLLISTLDEIFQGNRDLFKTLWLYDSPYQWQQHPVIRIDFSENPVGSAAELEETLTRIMQDIAGRHHITLRPGPPHLHFADLIRELGQQNQVVILIDEYDKPILDNLADTAVAQHIQRVLKGFYGVIKALDAHIRFVLLTGVSKFSRVGVFSDLNNLNDLTMHPRYHTLVGITQVELEHNFDDYLTELAAFSGQPMPELLEKIRLWYDGFCFSKRCEPVYNPFSLLRLFDAYDFQNYWFENSTPTFLIKLLKTKKYNLQQLETLHIPEIAFSTYDIESLEIVPLLFQTGYLTIKAYEDRFQTFTLSYPNYEVERAFMTYLLTAYSEIELAFTGSALKQLAMALLDADWERFFSALNTFLAMIDYTLHIKQERYYQTIFYLIFKLIGLEINAEVRTNQGRIDAVIEMDDALYIFEFKLDGETAVALAQIREKKYFAPYLLKNKTIHLIGVNFNMERRAVAAWETALAE